MRGRELRLLTFGPKGGRSNGPTEGPGSSMSNLAQAPQDTLAGDGQDEYDVCRGARRASASTSTSQLTSYCKLGIHYRRERRIGGRSGGRLSRSMMITRRVVANGETTLTVSWKTKWLTYTPNSALSSNPTSDFRRSILGLFQPSQQ